MLQSSPTGVWGHPAGTLVLTAVTLPQIVIQLLRADAAGWSGAATASQLVAAPLCGVAAAFTYVHYRMRRRPALGWLALCITAYSIQCVATALAGATVAGDPRRPGLLLIVDLAVAVGVATLAAVAGNLILRIDPLALGLLVGLTMSGLHLWIAAEDPDVIAPPAYLVGGAVVSLWALAAARLVRCPSALPRWMTQRLAIGCVSLAVARVCAIQGGAVPDSVVVIAGGLGTALVVSATLAGLRQELLQREERMTSLDRQVAMLEARQRDERSRLHEITNTVAGIASASNLIHSCETLPPQRRKHLEEMLDHESARLSRILADRSSARATEAAPVVDLRQEVVDLDALIRPLVTAQDAVGRQVQWTPSGLYAHGGYDAIVEALNILLDNSRKHAPGAVTVLEVRRSDDVVELVVTDDGPGVAAEMADRTFGWGERGPSSSGQGLGLHLARTRLQTCGGSVDLEPSSVGARFVIRLPAVLTVGTSSRAAS